VAKVVRLRRRVFGHAFLQETDDAIAHVDTRAPDSKLRAMRAVDIVETVLTVVASAISLDIVQERASAIVITVHRWLLSVTERLVLPPKKGRLVCPPSKNFKLHEWLVPPVPVFVGLMIAGAVIVLG
jgi:hypothetical protein